MLFCNLVASATDQKQLNLKKSQKRQTFPEQPVLDSTQIRYFFADEYSLSRHSCYSAIFTSKSKIIGLVSTFKLYSGRRV